MAIGLLIIGREYHERITKIEESIQEIKDLGAVQGPPGEQGPQGEPGYTPVKGVDYFTQEDIQALNFADKEHNHDGVYIKSAEFATESEIDSLF